MILPEDVFDEFISLGGWNSIADDTIHSEKLSVSFVEDLVRNYNRNPIDKGAINSLGLLVLSEAVGGWGMSDASDLPQDSAERAWKGPSRITSGKHLMSYSRGGIGIPHADSGFLEDLFDYIEQNHPDLAPKKDRFFKLKGVNFDILYANGTHCNMPTTVNMLDLNDIPFGHNKYKFAGEKYCRTYKQNADVDEEDWKIFRHWMREALRKKDVQKWIVERWIVKYWVESYNKVMNASGGSVEEAFINARIRNSSPVTANCAIEYARNSDNPVER
ncbi:MAG: hypothetical protein KAJ31_09710, partial [Deltaproteobacteria bacterium]|nr:hypothetical protein [Deltaproteobacteria bacterium]